jgi:hypothetical protein
MAAINLRAADLPWPYTFTAATTWQEVQLPPRCRVTVTCEGTAGYLGFPSAGVVASPEEPADGGAVGTHRQPINADAPSTFRVAPVTSYRDGCSIFLAATSGTPSITVLLESLES